MPTEQEAVAGEQVSVQTDPAPTAPDSAATQPAPATTDQDSQSHDLEAREANLREQLTGTTEPQTAAPEPEPQKTEPEQPSAGEKPAAEQETPAAPAEPEKPAEEQPKPEADATEPTTEELGKYHPSARRHIKRLLKERAGSKAELEHAKNALNGLADVCRDSGVAAAQAPAAISLFGAAFVRKDQQALAKIHQGLIDAGYQPAQQQASPAPSVDLEAIEAALKRFDYTTVEELVNKARGTASKPTQPPPQAPQPQQTPAQTQQSPGIDPALQRDVDAKLDAIEARCKQQYGHEADKLLKRVKTALQGKLSQSNYMAWPDLVEMAIKAETAAVSRPKVAPQTVTSARSAPKPISDLDQREADLRKRLVG